MGITFTSAAITVVGGNYTFEDIYQASVGAGNTYCKKLGTSYLIYTDLILGDESTATELSAQNISVVIEGDLFQVKKGATLKLGTRNMLTDATSNGVYISCPNIANGYGFGSKHKVSGLTQSGNVFLYDSFIDIYGFWGFFGGPTQHCEIIDCLVNGFGRIEGTNSILKNITTQKSNGRFGVLAAKGNIAVYENISSKDVKNYSGHTCSVYFNPTYAPAMRVVGGTYDGYTEGLCYLEPNSTGIPANGLITFVDTEIKNGFGGYFGDNSVQMDIRYTFNPKFKDENNNTMSDVQVIINDNNGAEVFNGLSDQNGKINVELLHHTATNVANETFIYYDVTASKGTVSVTRRYLAGKTFKDFPFFVAGGTSTGGNTDECCLDDIQAKLDLLQTAVFQKIEDEAGTTITHIDNSINDSHDKYKINAKNNKDAIINIVINGDGTSATNDDIMAEVGLIKTANESIKEWIVDTNNKVSTLLKKWIKRGL